MKKILLFVFILFSTYAKGQEFDELYIRNFISLSDSSVTNIATGDTLTTNEFVRLLLSNATSNISESEITVDSIRAKNDSIYLKSPVTGVYIRSDTIEANAYIGITSITASGGLSRVVDDISLGGILTSNTTIGNEDMYYVKFSNPYNSNEFQISPGYYSTYYESGSIYNSGTSDYNNTTLDIGDFTNNYYIYNDKIISATAANQYWSVQNPSSNEMKLNLHTTNGMTVTDEINSRGLENNADYSANSNARTLTDSAQVAGMISGSGVTASAGLTKAGNDIRLGGPTTANTTPITIDTDALMIGTSTPPANGDYLTVIFDPYGFGVTMMEYSSSVITSTHSVFVDNNGARMAYSPDPSDPENFVQVSSAGVTLGIEDVALFEVVKDTAYNKGHLVVDSTLYALNTIKVAVKDCVDIITTDVWINIKLDTVFQDISTPGFELTNDSLGVICRNEGFITMSGSAKFTNNSPGSSTGNIQLILYLNSIQVPDIYSTETRAFAAGGATTLIAPSFTINVEKNDTLYPKGRFSNANIDLDFPNEDVQPKFPYVLEFTQKPIKKK